MTAPAHLSNIAGARFRAPLLAAFVLSACATACGPSEPPPTTPAKPVASVTAATPPPPPEDRSPAEAPAGLAMQMHFAAPQAIADALAGYAPFAKAALEPRAVVRELPSGKALEKIVDVDRPVDVAMLLPPEGTDVDTPPEVAVAFGVVDGMDIDTALKGTLYTEYTTGGVRRLMRTGSGKRTPCVIAPALGPSKHRLVCAVELDTRSDPMRLVPWLARGVTRAPESQAAMRMDIDVAAVKKRYGQSLDKLRAQARAVASAEIRVGHAETDKVLKRLAKDLVDETFDVIDDLDSVSLEATTPKEGIATRMALAFSGNKSWTARAYTLDGPTGAPASFGKLPSDGVWLASWSKGNPQHDALLQPWQAAARDLVEAASADFKWPAKDKDLALDVVKWAFPSSADSAAVHGHLGQVEAPKEANLWGDARRVAHALMRKTFTLGVAARDAKASIALMKAFGAFVARPAFAQTLKSLTRDRLAIKVTTKDATPKGAPKGSFGQQYAIDLTSLESPSMPEAVDEKGKAKAKAKPKGKETPLGKLMASALAVPDGAQTWGAWGQNVSLDDLWARLSPVMTGGGTPISSNPMFAMATEGNATSGGMMLLGGLVRSVAEKQEKVEAMLAKLPDGGKGGFVWRAANTKTPKPMGETFVFVPRDAISAIGLLFEPH